MNLRNVVNLSFAMLAMVATPSVAASQLSHGPMVGAPTTTSAVLWARAPDAVSVYVEYRRLDSGAVLQTALQPVRAAADYTVQTPLANLQPGTRYEAWFMLADATGALSRSPSIYFVTQSAAPQQARFVVLTDFATGLTASPAVVAAGESKPDFAVLLGDLDHRGPGKDAKPRAAMRTMRRDMRDPATAIGGSFWAGLLRSDGGGKNQTPLYYVWDDHDYCENNVGRTCAAANDAFAVYREYFMPPVDNGLTGAAACQDSPGVWQRVDYGSLLSIFMLDARSARDDAAGTTMLGPCQMAWLKAGLQSSAATWKFIMSPVPFNGGTKTYDAWAAFPSERNELLTFIADAAIRNVIVVSGDIHSGGAIDDGRNAGLPEVSVPHANMPDTWVNTYCRLGPNNTVNSYPGTWLIGGLQDPNIGVTPVRCLRTTYPGRRAGPLPPPPYPLDGRSNGGFVDVRVNHDIAVITVRDATGVVRRGWRADGAEVPMRLDRQANR